MVYPIIRFPDSPVKSYTLPMRSIFGFMNVNLDAKLPGAGKLNVHSDSESNPIIASAGFAEA
jgi:hypothetical protein